MKERETEAATLQHPELFFIAAAMVLMKIA